MAGNCWVIIGRVVCGWLLCVFRLAARWVMNGCWVGVGWMGTAWSLGGWYLVW